MKAGKDARQLCISWTVLKKRIKAAKLNVPTIVNLMIEQGWTFYPNTLYRPLREKRELCLHTAEMNDLLAILREAGL